MKYNDPLLAFEESSKDLYYSTKVRHLVPLDELVGIQLEEVESINSFCVNLLFRDYTTSLTVFEADSYAGANEFIEQLLAQIRANTKTVIDIRKG